MLFVLKLPYDNKDEAKQIAKDAKIFFTFDFDKKITGAKLWYIVADSMENIPEYFIKYITRTDEKYIHTYNPSEKTKVDYAPVKNTSNTPPVFEYNDVVQTSDSIKNIVRDYIDYGDDENEDLDVTDLDNLYEEIDSTTDDTSFVIDDDKLDFSNFRNIIDSHVDKIISRYNTMKSMLKTDPELSNADLNKTIIKHITYYYLFNGGLINRDMFLTVFNYINKYENTPNATLDSYIDFIMKPVNKN